MRELIFSIGEIFDKNSQSGCLFQYDANYYHIPAYQRGYKWGSGENGAVTILLNDLWSAFESYQAQERKEYYLQYVTVKPIINSSNPCLEVIDGQQRLTTLSILLAILSLKLDLENSSKNKLNYAIRDNFFTEYVYDKRMLNELLTTNWEHFSTNERLNKQDIFYIHQALWCCNQFISNKPDVDGFYQYLLNHVKLIVNSVEPHIVSETVFKNLNSNKVPLTESELIKGLLITKVGRHNHHSFKEVMEVRASAGMYWDEITAWTNRPEIKRFYFNNKQDAMHELLYLTALVIQKNSVPNHTNGMSNDFSLFGFYHEYNDFTTVFDQIKKLKNTLADWYNNTRIYNLIGFLRFSRNTGNNNPAFLKRLLDFNSKSELVSHLKTEKDQLLTILNIDDLNYKETSDELHRVLLAINVFVKGQEKLRFNFFEFEQQKWSLEHIFPQTPEGKKKVLRPIDKEAISDILGDTITDEVKAVLELDSRTDQEKKVYYKALDEHGILHNIGNMCLLSGADNASNSNKFFDEKRENILMRLQIGSFVPKHTFDVFSKMFKNANTDQMSFWSLEDMNAHKEHIKQTLDLISLQKNL